MTNKPFFKTLSLLLICVFTLHQLVWTTPQDASAQTTLNTLTPLVYAAQYNLSDSTFSYQPAHLKGLKVFPDDDFKLDFMIDEGDSGLDTENLQQHATLLINYFLAALTIPEDELWVNLSPYEKNRIIPDQFGQTAMGQDLLEQDYLLKKITASLLFPDSPAGENFWQTIQEKIRQTTGKTDAPLNMLHKIWIMPQEATIEETENSVIIIDSRLKVMLEEDYIPLKENLRPNNPDDQHPTADTDPTTHSQLMTAEMRKSILPLIENEVNHGKQFATLRQIYHSLILAIWFKRHITRSLLSQAYADQNKIQGITTDDPYLTEKIYQSYLNDFKHGVFEHIKEEYNPETQEIISKKYFSGGFRVDPGFRFTPNQAMTSSPLLPIVSIQLTPTGNAYDKPAPPDNALLSAPKTDRYHQPHITQQYRKIFHDAKKAEAQQTHDNQHEHTLHQSRVFQRIQTLQATYRTILLEHKPQRITDGNTAIDALQMLELAYEHMDSYLTMTRKKLDSSSPLHRILETYAEEFHALHEMNIQWLSIFCYYRWPAGRNTKRDKKYQEHLKPLVKKSWDQIISASPQQPQTPQTQKIQEITALYTQTQKDSFSPEDILQKQQTITKEVLSQTIGSFNTSEHQLKHLFKSTAYTEAYASSTNSQQLRKNNIDGWIRGLFNFQDQNTADSIHKTVLNTLRPDLLKTDNRILRQHIVKWVSALAGIALGIAALQFSGVNESAYQTASKGIETIVETVETWQEKRERESYFEEEMLDTTITITEEEILQRAQNFTKEDGAEYFVNHILQGYLPQIFTIHGQTDDAVRDAAGRLSPKLETTFSMNLNYFYNNNPDNLTAKLHQLKQALIELDVYPYIYKYRQDERIYTFIYADTINQRVSLTDEDLRTLGENPDLYTNRMEAFLVSGEHYPFPDTKKGGFFTGTYAIVFPWTTYPVTTAFHELGHWLDQARLDVRDFQVPKGLSWKKLAKRVNKADIGIWLSPNIELNAVLTPLVVLDNPHQHLNEYILSWAFTGDKSSYYSQASKGILNGFRIWFDKDTLITDAFEPDLIQETADIINNLSADEVRSIAAMMYQNPQKYLATAKKGRYPSGKTNVEELSEDLYGSPEGAVLGAGKNYRFSIFPRFRFRFSFIFILSLISIPLMIWWDVLPSNRKKRSGRTRTHHFSVLKKNAPPNSLLAKIVAVFDRDIKKSTYSDSLRKYQPLIRTLNQEEIERLQLISALPDFDPTDKVRVFLIPEYLFILSVGRIRYFPNLKSPLLIELLEIEDSLNRLIRNEAGLSREDRERQFQQILKTYGQFQTVPSTLPETRVLLATLFKALSNDSYNISFAPRRIRPTPANSHLKYRRNRSGDDQEFDQLRLYVAGDPTNDMDWRTTAKTGKPYVRQHKPLAHNPTNVSIVINLENLATNSTTQKDLINSIKIFFKQYYVNQRDFPNGIHLANCIILFDGKQRTITFPPNGQTNYTVFAKKIITEITKVANQLPRDKQIFVGYKASTPAENQQLVQRMGFFGDDAPVEFSDRNSTDIPPDVYRKLAGITFAVGLTNAQQSQLKAKHPRAIYVWQGQNSVDIRTTASAAMTAEPNNKPSQVGGIDLDPQALNLKTVNSKNNPNLAEPNKSHSNPYAHISGLRITITNLSFQSEKEFLETPNLTELEAPKTYPTQN